MTFHEEKEINVDHHTKLFCSKFGEGSPNLIAIHGGPGLGHNYLLPQMAEIGKFCSIIFYDQRGTGKSISNDDWQSNPFQIYIHDIEKLREALGLKTITLIAHSWGSILASFYVSAYPERVDKIIYLTPVPVSSMDYLNFVKHRSQIVDSHKEELDAIRKTSAFTQGDPITIEKYYRIYFKNYFAHPEFIDNLTLKMNTQAAINNFKIYDLFFQHTMKHAFDLYKELKILNIKSLIIAGDKDVIPFSYIEQLHASLASSELVLLKDCGHFPYIDQPNVLFQKIHDFLSS